MTVNQWIPAAQVTRVGADAIMVADAIAVPMDEAAMPPIAEPAGLTPS